MASHRPDPSTVTCPAGFVQLLNDLRLWAGRPSLRRLRMLAGRTKSVHGHAIDALPISTTSALLAGKRLPQLPRGEFVEAYTRACLVAAAFAPDDIADEVRRWMDARHRLELASTPDSPTIAPIRSGPRAALAYGTAVVPRQLPAPPRGVLGRCQELARLSATMTANRENAVAICVVTGPGGVGKTWLALRWAHDNLQQYPDGQLHLDLHGSGRSRPPTAPDEAVHTFLVALGLAASEIPDGLDPRVGLYRSLVAGRRMLILLDDASDADQVRPLLPGTASCDVIVTSRVQLTGLIVQDAADRLTLHPLAPADAYRLLVHRLGEDRLAAEPDAAADIIDHCARLPLALASAAAQAASHPWRTLRALADELRDSRARS